MKHGENGHLKKIIWTINPFDEVTEVQENLAQVLGRIAKQTGAEIEPLTSVTTWEVFAPNSVEDFRVIMEKKLKMFLKKVNIPTLLPTKVLVTEVSSNAQAIKALDKYATEAKADVIAVGTHGRRGLPRFVMGSFAENLILHAKNPVLVVGPKEQEFQLDHILFPTDFQKTSEHVFKKVLEYARNLRASITILNILRPLILPVTAFGAMGGEEWEGSTDILLRDVEQAKRELAQKWVDQAKAHDVKADSVVSSLSGESIAREILKFSKERKIGFIAMAAESGVVETTLLGSVTRQVIRQAPCPVLILRDTLKK